VNQDARHAKWSQDFSPHFIAGTGGASTILIEAGGTITLQSALPALGSMTILGNGHAVSANDSVRVFGIVSNRLIESTSRDPSPRDLTGVSTPIAVR
jgi:hypothetical protein